MAAMLGLKECTVFAWLFLGGALALGTPSCRAVKQPREPPRRTMGLGPQHVSARFSAVPGSPLLICQPRSHTPAQGVPHAPSSLQNSTRRIVSGTVRGSYTPLG